MIDTKKFYDYLNKELDITGYTGVPCSNLKYLINYSINKGEFIPSYNEGDSVAYAVGSYLSNKNVAVFMQNSGLGNAVSPISSLSYINDIPLRFIIGYRGMAGTKDEPQHELMGIITEDMLKLLRIPYAVVKSDEDYQNLNIDKDKPFAFLIPKGTMSEVGLTSDKYENITLDTREEVLRKNVLPEVKPEDIIVTTTGFTSRTLFNLKDRDLNFYQVGSMGCAINIAIALAEHNPDRRVYLVDGDGSVLMRPSGYLMLLDDYFRGKFYNLKVVILDNEAYESTGGQDIGSLGVYKLIEALDSYYPLDEIFSLVRTRTGGDTSLDRPTVSRIKEMRDKFREELK